jgi:iron complex transport system permease protein
VLAVAVGAVPISPIRVLEALAGRTDAMTGTIVRDLRLPRAAAAAQLGAALAVAGTVFQALLRNPLAEPYILGISGGAAVGAVAVIGFAGAVAAWAVPAAAFAGAIVAIVLVFRIAAAVGRALDTRVLLLAGVVVGAFFNAVILLLLTFSDIESFRSAVFWMMGSLATASWTGVGILGLYLVPASIALVALARPLNLMAVGEETALYLGTHVERVRTIAYLVASLLVGVVHGGDVARRHVTDQSQRRGLGDDPTDGRRPVVLHLQARQRLLDDHVPDAEDDVADPAREPLDRRVCHWQSALGQVVDDGVLVE